MAEPTPVPLNTFRLVTTPLSAGSTTIYTTPSGVTGIILSSQISNKSDILQIVSAIIIRANTTQASLLHNGKIPPQDALNPLTGKLVLEEGDTLVFTSSISGSDAVLSVLENATT